MLLSKVSILAIVAANYHAAADQFVDRPNDETWERQEQMMYAYRTAFVMDEPQLIAKLQSSPVGDWDRLLDPRNDQTLKQTLTASV